MPTPPLPPPPQQVLEEEPLECVICMQEFTHQNPLVPTRCGCGLNMALFHHDCLRQWMQMKPTCPSCDEPLIVMSVPSFRPSQHLFQVGLHAHL